MGGGGNQFWMFIMLCTDLLFLVGCVWVNFGLQQKGTCQV